MSTPKTMSGFSLLEVLVAFSITAVTLVIIFNIYAKGTSAAILGEEYAQAIAIAESRLASLGISENMDSTSLQGMENDKYQWSLQINDYLNNEATDSDIATPFMLKQVEITVNWNSRGKPRSITLQTLKPVFDL